MVLAETPPVGGDVAGVPDRQDEVVGRVAQLVDDLERGRLLALDPMWVHRVHQGYGVPAGEVAHGFQRVVEVALQCDHLRSIHQGLRQLVERDFARRDHNDRARTGARRVCRHRRRRVAGRRAHEDSVACLQRLGHGDDHAPVLERARGIQAFVLEVEVLEAQRLADVEARHKWGRALLEVDLRRRWSDR